MMAIHLYHLHRLSDPKEAYESFKGTVISKFGTINSETTEYSNRGRKLTKLIRSLEPKSVIVVRSLFNLGEPGTAIKLLELMIENRIRLVSFQERIVVDPMKRSTVLLGKVLGGIRIGGALSIREQKKRAALITQWMGIHLGRKSIDSKIKAEVISLLREGHSSRKVASLLKGRVSKTTVCEIKKGLR